MLTESTKIWYLWYFRAQDFIIAGSYTTSVSIEWAIAELLHYPHFMKRAQGEIDSVVGKDRLVDEQDIKNMPFLQAIIK